MAELTARQYAFKLNEQAQRGSGAGFYGPGGRFASARVHAGRLEVLHAYDRVWAAAPIGATYRDYNGRDFLTIQEY